MTSIQSTLRIATDLCKNVSLAALFGSNVNSYTVSMHSDVWIYTHVVHNIETLVGQAKYKRNGIAMNAACQGNLSVWSVGHASRWFVNLGEGQWLSPSASLEGMEKRRVDAVVLRKGCRSLQRLPPQQYKDTHDLFWFAMETEVLSSNTE